MNLHKLQSHPERNINNKQLGEKYKIPLHFEKYSSNLKGKTGMKI